MTQIVEKEAIRVSAGDVELNGDLSIPSPVVGVILFAHGSGSSRHSPRNLFVASHLQQEGMSTLLMDLLTPEEERADQRTGHLRFDIEFLAQRLVAALEWLKAHDSTAPLPVAIFGASTGGGAALVAAAQRPKAVRAVVSRGGRPDLAGEHLHLVKCPTLLIVGSRDRVVIDLNKEAMARMRSPVELQLVEGATHLFEEPDTLEKVAEIATQWLKTQFEAA